MKLKAFLTAVLVIVFLIACLYYLGTGHPLIPNWQRWS